VKTLAGACTPCWVWTSVESGGGGGGYYGAITRICSLVVARKVRAMEDGKRDGEDD
jgi:hypothetical protein